MDLKVRTLGEEPALRDRFHDFHRQAWPRFLWDGDATGGLFPRIYTDFADFQFGLWDEAGALVAVGNTIPFICDGSTADLPPDIKEILERGLAVKQEGRKPTALSALAAIVDETQRARGLSTKVIEAMAELARRHELKTLVAPVRPSLKQHYPLTPMERYITWMRADGTHFDPWLRVHLRMGAEILRVAPKSMVITDTVARWEEWTGLRFPESGNYVVPGAFQPVKIDVRRNTGRYEEANVWMRHPLSPHPALSPKGRGKAN
jgi:hypothetical protein